MLICYVLLVMLCLMLFDYVFVVMLLFCFYLLNIFLKKRRKCIRFRY